MGYVSRNSILLDPNNKSQYAIEPKFEMAGDFDNGLAEVSIDVFFCTIDENGNIVYSKSDNKEKVPVLKK